MYIYEYYMKYIWHPKANNAAFDSNRIQNYADKWQLPAIQIYHYQYRYL